MKNFRIEILVNPTNDWKKHKQFDTLEKAMQSFEMLKKHRYNLFKNSEYQKYRIYDKANKLYHY